MLSITPSRCQGEDASASLIIAWSFFTHVLQDDISYYWSSAPDSSTRRVDTVNLVRLRQAIFPDDAVIQNALYINPENPTNAVIVDREWLFQTLLSAGLTVASAQPPDIRGFQWVVDLRHSVPGDVPTFSFDDDETPLGHRPPPIGGRTLT